MKWRQEQMKHKVIASIQSKILGDIAFFQSPVLYKTVLSS